MAQQPVTLELPRRPTGDFRFQHLGWGLPSPLSQSLHLIVVRTSFQKAPMQKEALRLEVSRCVFLRREKLAEFVVIQHLSLK